MDGGGWPKDGRGFMDGRERGVIEKL